MLVDEVLSRPMRDSPRIVQSRFGLFTASSPWSEARRDRFNEFPHRRQLYPARRSAAERVVYAVVIMNSELVGVLVLWAARQQASRPFRKHLVVLLQVASGSAA